MPDSIFIWTFGDVVGLVILVIFLAVIAAGTVVEVIKWGLKALMGVFRGTNKR